VEVWECRVAESIARPWPGETNPQRSEEKRELRQVAGEQSEEILIAEKNQEDADEKGVKTESRRCR
jgi:hypothetical protein